MMESTVAGEEGREEAGRKEGVFQSLWEKYHHKRDREHDGRTKPGKLHVIQRPAEAAVYADIAIRPLSKVDLC